MSEPVFSGLRTVQVRFRDSTTWAYIAVQSLFAVTRARITLCDSWLHLFTERTMACDRPEEVLPRLWFNGTLETVNARPTSWQASEVDINGQNRDYGDKAKAPGNPRGLCSACPAHRGHHSGHHTGCARRPQTR